MVSAPRLLSITADDSICRLIPELGGSLASWHIGDQAMLRTASADNIAASEPLGMASFPLVPYSNRIGDARFDWAGERIKLAHTFAPEPHAIHGVGWKSAWTAERHTDASVTLVLKHAADEHWPWDFEALQTISIAPYELRLDLSVRNLAACDVPLAFGHHPYFEQAGASLCFDAGKVWMTGDDQLPSEAIDLAGQFDFRRGAPIEGRSIDHCYAGVLGSAFIEWADRRWALEIVSPLSAAVVYVPAGGDAFCFEPVPHINNALNMPGVMPSMPVIAAGKLFETSIQLNARLKYAVVK